MLDVIEVLLEPLLLDHGLLTAPSFALLLSGATIVVVGFIRQARVQEIEIRVIGTTSTIACAIVELPEMLQQ